MALKQTRKTISLSRGVFNAVSWAAAQSNKTTSAYLTDLIRQHVADVPATTHVERHEAARARAAREKAARPDSRYTKLVNDVARMRGVLDRIEARFGDDK